MTLHLYYTDHFHLPLPTGHRFPMDKYQRLRQQIAASDWADRVQFHEPAAATDEQLLRVHTADYVQRVTEGRLTAREVRRIGFPWSRGFVERSRRSTGATIAASRQALQSGIAVNLAGGTHHAFADRGEGFCVFNDAAVAARELQAHHQAKQILVVDCDVHQGNGTADIFRDDPRVTTFSMHGKRNYPAIKPLSDLDIALPDGTGDEAYLDALQQALIHLRAGSDFDFVFYLAGADPFEGDRLGRLKLTKQGLEQRDELVLSTFRQQQVPVAISMAGGYAEAIEDIVDIHCATVRVAARQTAPLM